MRVVRAILGRFARFLVRIARTLDPALATGPYWVMPERMAALRQRYPGAPEHWLEFVARRTAIGETPSSHVPPSESRPPIEPQQPQARSRPRDTLRNFLRMRVRPAVTFPRPDSRPRAHPGTRRIGVSADRRRQTAPSLAGQASTRPALTFSTSSVRNPIANLLRIARPERRSAMLHFHSDDPVHREKREASEHEEFVRREHRTVFPDRDARPPHHPDVIGSSDAPGDMAASRSEMRWPGRTERPSSDLTWRSDPSRTVRPDPGFRAQDPRWPELPLSPVDYRPSPTPSLDEAILLAEQIGGTWSG